MARRIGNRGPLRSPSWHLAGIGVCLAASACAQTGPPPVSLWNPGRLLPEIGLYAAPEASALAVAESDPPLAIAVGTGGRAITVGAEERNGWIVHHLVSFDADGRVAGRLVTKLVPGLSRETPFAATDEGAVIAAAPLARPRDGETELPMAEPSILLFGFEGEVRWRQRLDPGFCGLAGDRAGGVWIVTDGVAERRDVRDGKLVARVDVGRCGQLAASDDGDALLVWDDMLATLVGAGGAVHREIEAIPGSPFAWGSVGPSYALLRVSRFGGVLAVPRSGAPALLVAESRVRTPTGVKLSRVDLPSREQIGTAVEVRGRILVTTEDRVRLYAEDGQVERTLTLSCPGAGIGAVGCHAISSAAPPGGPAYLVIARLRAHGSAGEPIVDLESGWLVALDPRTLRVKWRATLPEAIPGAVGAAAFSNLRGPWAHDDAVLAWRPSKGLQWFRP